MRIFDMKLHRVRRNVNHIRSLMIIMQVQND
jgi:hypothetical protein